MGCNKCACSLCGLPGIVLSIILGIAVGFLFAYEFIPNIFTVAWISFGIAAFALIALLASLVLAAITGKSPLSKCLCEYTTCLLVGILGTLIVSIIALSINLVTSVILIAVIVGIGAFFFAFMLLGIIGFFSCIAKKLCYSSSPC